MTQFSPQEATSAPEPVPTDAALVLQRGKIPPQNLYLEEVVLGGMLLDKRGIDEVIDLLSKEVFYKSSHQLIFEAIMELFQDSQPIDLMTVYHKLEKTGKLKAVGGLGVLVELTQKVSSSAHIEFHANILLQKFIQRSLITMANQIIEEAFDDTTDVFKLLDSAEGKLFAISQGNVKKTAESAQDLVAKSIKRIKELSEKKEQFSGVPSGFVGIDQITAGWQPTDLIVVAARPAMGKTAFTLKMARNIAIETGQGVGFFSLEMGSVQLITRLISAETGLSADKLRTGKLEPYEWEQLYAKVQKLEKAPLYIDDNPELTVFDLRAKARRMVSQYKVKIIIIDYLQLITAAGSKGAGTREQEISTISRNLKALAKELNIPIIALAQLSRNVEQRNTGVSHKRPQLSDLRESGAIEQDADIVTFLYRPEYYKIDNWDDEEGSPTKGQAEFIIAKHRNGGLGNIRLRFEYGVFDNLETAPASPFEIHSRFNPQAEPQPDFYPPTPTASPTAAFMPPPLPPDEADDIPF